MEIMCFCTLGLKDRFHTLKRYIAITNAMSLAGEGDTTKCAIEEVSLTAERASIIPQSPFKVKSG